VTLLQSRNLTKSYGGVTALHAVNFDLRQGEIHALVGENGAGKSTLCRILCGIIPAESGDMRLLDESYTPISRRHAQDLGVRMVMQELNLISTLSVAENIFLDALPARLGFIDRRALSDAAASAIASVGLHDVASDQAVQTLGVGQCQLVEIAAALSRQCRVLVLDEPTASLTQPEIELLFTQIRCLKSAGVAIVYVSHRMDEIRAIADRITVLRDGHFIATHDTPSVSHDQLIREMVGRDLPQAFSSTAPSSDGKAIALSVRNLSRRSAIRDVTFDLHFGEILGLAGLMGSGRTETLRAIFAADRPDAGQLFLRGSKLPATIRSPRDAVRQGIALLTEDRKTQGLLLPLSIANNITLSCLHSMSRASFISAGRESTIARDHIQTLSIRCRSEHQSTSQLSGGNQQKVVIAKWLLRDCDILLFDEPTRGIDVGAKFEIYQLLERLARRGKAILVVSSDLLELMAISHRIAVMSAGRLVRIFDHGAWTQEQIMSAALSGYSKQTIASA
jgi:ribose transport system ATP-binding protein